MFLWVLYFASGWAGVGAVFLYFFYLFAVKYARRSDRRGYMRVNDTSDVYLRGRLCALRGCISDVVGVSAVLRRHFRYFKTKLAGSGMSVSFRSVPRSSFRSFRSTFGGRVISSPLLRFGVVASVAVSVRVVPAARAGRPSRAASFILRPAPHGVPAKRTVDSTLLSVGARCSCCPLSAARIGVVIAGCSRRRCAYNGNCDLTCCGSGGRR